MAILASTAIIATIVFIVVLAIDTTATNREIAQYDLLNDCYTRHSVEGCNNTFGIPN